MKTALSIFTLLFAFSFFASATTTKKTKLKRVPVSKVIKAIKKDPKKALKDYGKDFECRFAVKDVKIIKNINYAKVKVKESTPVKYQSGPTSTELKTGKKFLCVCKLEKYKENGKEKIRFLVLKKLK